MRRSIDYYFSLVSPWAYIGHATFTNLTQRHNLDVNFKPVSLPTVFAETGGLPLNKRAPARQRYRIMELQRFTSTPLMSLSSPAKPAGAAAASGQYAPAAPIAGILHGASPQRGEGKSRCGCHRHIIASGMWERLTRRRRRDWSLAKIAEHNCRR